jgi:hypothetical protein
VDIGYIWWMHFVSIYENTRMKPIEIVLRRKGGRRERTMEGVNSRYILNTCKYHNVSSYTTIIC